MKAVTEKTETYGPKGLPVRVEVAAFRASAPGQLEVALRLREVEPFRGFWFLPGEFVREDEDLAVAARRGLRLLGVDEDVPLEQVIADARPKRDPRGHLVSVLHAALLRDPPRDAPDLRWTSVNAIPPLGFGHAALLETALVSLRERAVSTPLVFAILPDAFTLGDLQSLLETVLGEGMDRRNFRRKMKDAAFLSPVRGQQRVGRHRPAQMYRFKPDAFAKWAGRFRGRDFLR